MRMDRRLVGALLAVAALAAACSSGGDADDGSAATTTTGDGAAVTEVSTAPAEIAATVEQFAGSDDEFYVVPDPLPAGAPGDVIRTMAIDAPDGQTGLRVMYHSTDAEGDDRAVTEVVYFPTDEPPDGGWPIVAWAHGTSGLAASCAPSRSPSPPPSFGVQGVLVATDYIGLGPVGETHPYLSAAAEGNAVIDGVAAARLLPDVHAGDEWVATGVSQGGHAALVTNERAADRLPDADLLGTVAFAPGSQLGETYGDDLQANVIVTMVLVGAAAEDPTIDLADYLGPDALAVVPTIEEGCMGDIMSTVVPAATSPDYFVSDPRSGALGDAWLAENDPAQVASASPLLLAQGGQDIIVMPARTDALFDRLCAVGQVVERVDVPTASHDTIVDDTYAAASAWIADRFAGDPAPDDC